MLADIRGSVRVDAGRTDVAMRGVELTGDSSVKIDRGNLALGLVENQALMADFASDPRWRCNRRGAAFGER